MAGLVPAIHVVHLWQIVDARPKAGHDGSGLRECQTKMRWPALWVFGLAATIALAALIVWRWEVEDQAIRLEPVSFAEIAGWATDDHEAAFAALLKSCGKKSARDARQTCARTRSREIATG